MDSSDVLRFHSDTGGSADLIWVRSDCKSRTRPGPSYRKQSIRFCTLCRGAIHAKQPFGPECRFTAALQTRHRAVLKVGT
jgi:hypothetical protein